MSDKFIETCNICLWNFQFGWKVIWNSKPDKDMSKTPQNLLRRWWNPDEFRWLHAKNNINSWWISIDLCQILTQLKDWGNRNFIISSNHSIPYKQYLKLKWAMTVKKSILEMKRLKSPRILSRIKIPI